MYFLSSVLITFSLVQFDSTFSFHFLERFGSETSRANVSPLKSLRSSGGLIYGPNGEDLVWDALRKDASIEAANEPLLASFMHAAILSHNSLERSLAFHMANQLESSTMISTQIQALFLEALEKSEEFRHATFLSLFKSVFDFTLVISRKSLRYDIYAVMDRDPAVRTSPDVLLYFKGFQALQTHRVSHYLWLTGRQTLALFLQSQANNAFHIDIHPGAKFGSGVFIDHGTGVVVGETAVIGNNVSMLHQVTLGGSGIKTVDRHPKIGDGVLIGAGATILGNIKIGKGANIGACTMVLEDVPPFAVAVGVPARIIMRKPTAVTENTPSPAALSMETNMGTILDYII